MARSEKWLVYLKTGVSGPHDQAGLSDLYRRGELTAATRIKPPNGERWQFISQIPEVWQSLKPPESPPPQGSTQLREKAVERQPAGAPRATRLTDSDELFGFDDPLEQSAAALPRRGVAPTSPSEHQPDTGPSFGRSEEPSSLPPGSLVDPLSPQPPVLDPLRRTFAALGPGDYLNLDEEPEVAVPNRKSALTARPVKQGFFDIPSEPSQRVVLILLISLLGPFLLIWLVTFLLVMLNGLLELLEPRELTLHRGARGLELASLCRTAW